MLTLTARANASAELLIYDEIAAYGGVSAKDIDTQLKGLGRLQTLTVRVNSPGGETPQAAAIVNMLERVKASGTRVVVWVDGIAASAASWIAMVGDEVIMPENALMMIYNPAGVVVGPADDMRDLAAVLDKIQNSMVSAYAKKSGKTRAEVQAIMAAETWYTAAEAVAAGFADRVEQPIRIAATFDPGKFSRRPPRAMLQDFSRSFWAAYRKGDAAVH